MKKIFFFITIFFLISINNSISAPIKLFDLDVTMGMKTSEEILTNKNYKCSNVMDLYVTCVNSEKRISIGNDFIEIQCSVYNGCKNTVVEVVKFFEKELNFQARNPETFGITNDPAFCGEGPDGDKICFVYTIASELGPSIWIKKHKLGSSGMTLN